MIKRLLVVLAVMVLPVATAPVALAYEPVNVVHTERVQAGPYGLTVGFSTWPLRAMQSLDFTFMPDGGITGKSGTLSRGLTGTKFRSVGAPLVRHPRKRDVWGLDVVAMPIQGDWTFTFDIDGPLGHGEGSLTNLMVLAQPGPPLALSWVVCAIPFAALIAFLVIAWRRVRPAQRLGSLA